MSQEPVQAGNSHIVKPDDLIAIDLSRKCRFLRHRYITGAACSNNYTAYAVFFRHRAAYPYTRLGIIIILYLLAHSLSLISIQSRDKYGIVRRLTERLHYPYNLPRTLTCTIYDLCRALTQPAVMISLGISKIRIRLLLYLKESLIHADIASS